MNVHINGESKVISDNLQTIQDLLFALKIKPEKIVVEKNGEIIDRNHYSAEPINSGDIFELIRFMGGG